MYQFRLLTLPNKSFWMQSTTAIPLASDHQVDLITHLRKKVSLHDDNSIFGD